MKGLLLRTYFKLLINQSFEIYSFMPFPLLFLIIFRHYCWTFNVVSSLWDSFDPILLWGNTTKITDFDQKFVPKHWTRRALAWFLGFKDGLAHKNDFLDSLGLKFYFRYKLISHGLIAFSCSGLLFWLCLHALKFDQIFGASLAGLRFHLDQRAG